MADNLTVKKFLNQAGVSTLWGEVAKAVKAEADRAKLAEQANAAAAAEAKAAAQTAQNEIDALELYVGTIPEGYTESNIVAYIKKVATETLAAASGNSTETAASVKAQLDAYVASNDLVVGAHGESIAAVVADYLKKADKDELAGLISDNADEITRIDNALKAAIENDGEGLDSIKELATWIEEHGTDAAGYAAAIDALEALVGDTAVATQIANAIAAENLAQYAKAADLVTTNNNLTALVNKVDTGDLTVSAAINAAVTALNIGDYAKAADLTALAARVSTVEGKVATLEGKVATLEQHDADHESRIVAMENKVTKWDNAENNAKLYAEEKAGAAEEAAKAHSDANLATAKAYSDANLATAKEYTVTAFGKIQALSDAEILKAIADATAV